MQLSGYINVFNRQTFTFDYCTCMIGRHRVGADFPDLHCQPVICCLSVYSELETCTGISLYFGKHMMALWGEPNSRVYSWEILDGLCGWPNSPV